MRADGLAVPARHPRQAVGDVLDFNVASPPGPQEMRAIASTRRSFAQEVQRPQPSPTPRPVARSCVVRAPLSAAWMIWRSVIALQRQMYMGRAYGTRIRKQTFTPD